MAIAADLKDGARICHEPLEQDDDRKANSANEYGYARSNVVPKYYRCRLCLCCSWPSAVSSPGRAEVCPEQQFGGGEAGPKQRGGSEPEAASVHRQAASLNALPVSTGCASDTRKPRGCTLTRSILPKTDSESHAVHTGKKECWQLQGPDSEHVTLN